MDQALKLCFPSTLGCFNVPMAKRPNIYFHVVCVPFYTLSPFIFSLKKKKEDEENKKLFGIPNHIYGGSL